MSLIDELGANVRLIGATVENNVRANPESHARGWGQFVDAAAHAHQIGPYGTCSGLLLLSLTKPNAQIDPQIIAQIKSFWDGEQRDIRLFEQNVRLAFLVLCLAKIDQRDLRGIRTQVVRELRQRQQNDGSWGDSHNAGEMHHPGRAETTAWVVLALARLDQADAAAQRGAEYLVSQLPEIDNEELSPLSPLAVGAAITVLGVDDARYSELRQRAKAILYDRQISSEEHISFFDYAMPGQEPTRMARDYLCFPAYYPTALLLTGLRRTRKFYEIWPLAICRITTIERLLKRVGMGRLYKLPGARFAATVDQAIIALAFEQLGASVEPVDPVAARLRPIIDWISKSIWTRLVIPVLLWASAIITLQSPEAIPDLITLTTGLAASPLHEFANENGALIQLIVAIVVTLLSHLPASMLDYVRKRVRL